MDTSKTCHVSDIPSKIIKENADIFTKYFLLGLGNALTQFEFPPILKLFKKSERNLNKN